MKNALTLSLAVTLLGLSTFAQDAPVPTSHKEHTWLKQFAGEWTSTSASMGQQMTSSMSSRMLGQHWIVNTMKADMNGLAFESLQTIGYDPKKGKYVGTWVDSMMNYLWHYEGTVDASGKKLTLDAEGPHFTSGKMTKYRDSYEFKTPDLIIATSEIMGDDGKWSTIMTAEVKRKTTTP
jgi:hypothetical protein